MIDTYQEDELIPRENWFPQVVEYLAAFQSEYPEEYDLLAARRYAPEIFERIMQKCHELDRLGAATEETILQFLRQLEGLFSQARWRRKGFSKAEMALDPDGYVVALLIHGRDFEQRLHLKRLIGHWATTDPEFQSPDGGLVHQLEELESLLTMTDAEQIAFLNSKLH